MPRIFITPGEPAGIGPDITLLAAQKPWATELVAICDPEALKLRAAQLNIAVDFSQCDITQAPKQHQPGTLKILPVQQKHPTELGKLNPSNAQYVIHCLELAATLCQQKSGQALVTGPVHKANINAAGITFTGHTEFLAKYTKTLHSVMLFVTPEIRVALATTHLPLAKVPAAITSSLLKSVLMVLHQDLKQKFHLKDPRIVVCGLNPHAGENGYLGREEVDIIEPTLNQLRQEGLNIKGPVAADTVFTPKQLIESDAVLAMYHDQALPVVKYLSFGSAVNVTLGLPFIRTSVDHGIAMDAAGTGRADASSLIAAIELAIQLAT
ncbi:MAG: 4-hydroxythreonine-4-phosphate dehydrogenase PdxA [Gammaproteobacteria bacterium]|nr:4-hydroxythreonine-4-phosphate dehydrogenase PdxA [Gammaproteobacteria bacterium]